MLYPYVGILKGSIPRATEHRYDPPKGYQSCYKIEVEMNGRVTADAKDLLYDVGYVSTLLDTSIAYAYMMHLRSTVIG